MITYEKEKLPIPILEGHEDWIELYYLAWETAFKNIEYIDKPGWNHLAMGLLLHDIHHQLLQQHAICFSQSR